MFWNKKIHQLEQKIEYYKKQISEQSDSIAVLHKELVSLRECKKELDMIKPVVETSGFRPAMSDKCDNCKFAYYSDYDDTLIGCCKDVVCKDFVPYKKEQENEE